ncbi:MAG: hypothetical protein AAGA58_07800 [Verrucomicrobiota bacterium]
MMRFTSQLRKASLRALALLATASCVCAQGQGTLVSKSELERRVRDLEAANRNLSESLLSANGELREVTENYRKLRVEMEAFGIESVRKGSEGTARRLMQAVNENLLLDEENKALRKALVGLVDATLSLQASSPSADQRVSRQVADALGEADRALGAADRKLDKRDRSQLSQGGKIVSVKQDLGIAVVDLGTSQGVNIGMPFSLMRNGKPVGAATVVDVRDHISGIYVHQFSGNTGKVAVGDLAFLQTQPNR